MKKLIYTFCLLLLTQVVFGQKRNASYEQYIKTYSGIAVEEMNKYGIPASITLAQGILESGAGTSYLAKSGNNHFGIKCHEWTGPKIYKDDNKKGECFRKYKHAKESFEDHSKFLTTRAHYAPLFKLKTTDYKGWAKGLKNAGYATNPKYPELLIKIIEDYELYKYDKDVNQKKSSTTTTKKSSKKAKKKKR